MKATAKCGNNHVTKIDPEFDELVCPICGEPLEINSTPPIKKSLIALALIFLVILFFMLKGDDTGGGSVSSDYTYKFSFKSITNEMFIKKSNSDNSNNYDNYANGYAEMSKFNYYLEDNLGNIYPINKKQIRQSQNGKAGQFIICDESIVGQLYVEGVDEKKYKSLGSEKKWEGKSLRLIKGGIVQGATKNIDEERNCFKFPIRFSDVIAELGAFGILEVKLNDNLHHSDKRKFNYILNNSIVSKVNRFELCKLKNRPDISIVSVYEEGVDTLIQKPIKSAAISTTKEKCNCSLRENEVKNLKLKIMSEFKDLENDCTNGRAIGKAGMSLPSNLWTEHPDLKDISDTNIKNGRIPWDNFMTLCALGKIRGVKIYDRSFVFAKSPDGGSRLVGIKLER